MNIELTENDAEAIINKLDQRCWACKDKTKPEPDCQRCHGAGKELTYAGELLVEFIARHQNRIQQRSNQ